ncbi:MAG: Uncharacterized protein G01um10147_375 [Microgenomates group bacterium Gr01-1014_7]|nr:MAG: Uncharacterized protein G01um10147_375 [Microgenomates group bacterium Gr01-1014_7]
MNLKIAQVIGLNTDQKAAQVSSGVRGDNSFFAVLDLTCDDAFTKGRQILSQLSDFYFDFEGSPAEKLSATFEEAKEKFAASQYSLLLASSSGKALYLIFSGEVEVYLKRDEKLSSLLSVGSSSQLISGFLQGGDRLLFSTKSLTGFLGEDLEKSLNLPLEVFEQEITDRIGASNLENQGLAGLVVEIQEEEKEEIPSLEQEVYESTPGVTSDDSPRSSKIINYLVTPLVVFKKFFAIYFPRSGKVRLIMAVILIVVIALGVGLKVKAGKDVARDVTFNQALQQARDDFSAAKGLSSLNPSDAKAKLDSARQNLDKALSLKPKEAQAQDLKKQIEAESGSILQQSTASEFPVFLDMDLIKKNFRASQMSLSGNNLLLLDRSVKTLVAVDLTKKSNQILAGSDQLGEATLASLNGGLAFVFSKDKGVLRVDTGSQKVTSVSKVDRDWGEILDLAGFAGNVYLLDLANPSATGSASSPQAGSGQIWKYLPTADGYSDSREYLSKNTKTNFANSLRMQIESSIYILKSGGEILRFTKGDKDNFGLEGLDKGVKDPKSIFTSSDTDNLYVLDSGNSRLLILTKTGKYKGQISGEKFASASDVVVDEKGKKVYLLEGSKIYSVDLK